MLLMHLHTLDGPDYGRFINTRLNIFNNLYNFTIFYRMLRLS